MLMMRLQRVGRKNDPSYRLVVTDKRTGPKSNKHVAILGSYNPKMNHVQIDKTAVQEWLSKGVQPSDTVHNILVGQKVIEAPKKNVLPKKSPIVDEEALAREAEEKAAAEAAAAEEAKADEVNSSDTSSEVAEETPADVPAEEIQVDTPAEEAKDEAMEEFKSDESVVEAESDTTEGGEADASEESDQEKTKIE